MYLYLCTIPTSNIMFIFTAFPSRYQCTKCGNYYKYNNCTNRTCVDINGLSAVWIQNSSIRFVCENSIRKLILNGTWWQYIKHLANKMFVSVYIIYNVHANILYCFKYWSSNMISVIFFVCILLYLIIYVFFFHHSLALDAFLSLLGLSTLNRPFLYLRISTCTAGQYNIIFLIFL